MAGALGSGTIIRETQQLPNVGQQKAAPAATQVKDNNNDFIRERRGLLPGSSMKT